MFMPVNEKNRPSIFLRVLNVGDGACSIYTRPWQNEHFIVDCGATSSGRGIASATILSEALGHSSRVIETVLITHFDADHWAGIMAYPEVWAVAPQRSVSMHYPHLLPRAEGRVQAAHLLFQAALAGMSITPITGIVNAWIAGGARVFPRAVKRGDDIQAVGKQWDVHWPPVDSSVFRPKTRATMKQIEDTVDELSAESDVFRRGLESVYTDWASVEQRAEIADGEPLNGESDVSAASVIASLNLDDERLTRIAAALPAYANLLSVVHSTDTIINFGDCEKAGLNALLRLQASPTPDLKSAYELVIAPHHGTPIPGVRTREVFPRALLAFL
ncbi:MBL fold metallo-hydrolase, partial [Microbacterium sp. ISL-103]|uniref:MBL fold metallo-hydrolase n=1 Tax=Microbacterium sp. ISL-103 TaxID=2819156 RepID=UPI001BEC8DB2